MDRCRFLLVLGLALPCAAAPSVGVQAMQATPLSAAVAPPVEAEWSPPVHRVTVVGNRSAVDASEKPDATWVKRMVRPCARSGNRLVC